MVSHDAPRREIQFKPGEMADGCWEEGSGNKTTTPVKNSELCGGDGDGLAHGNRSSDPDKAGAVSESEERRESPVEPVGLKEGASSCSSPGSGGANGDLSGSGGRRSSAGGGVNIRLDSVKRLDGSETESYPESSTLPMESASPDDPEGRTMSARQAAGDDEQIARRAREEGQVDVVLPGIVTQDSCCRFVCEILKCVLYQRQQLPMTYDQMVFFQKQQHMSLQSEEAAVKTSAKTAGGLNRNKCQRTLQDLDDVLGNLEALFSLSHVPRVIFLLGGSIVLPTELYEVNMETLVLGGGEGTLRTSACLRQLFRTLFVADLLSDVKPVRLTGTTVMALAHRDCGVAWFKPKVNFRIPTRVKRQVISLASDTSVTAMQKPATDRDWDNYIWFQAPVTIKGFCK